MKLNMSKVKMQPIKNISKHCMPTFSNIAKHCQTLPNISRSGNLEFKLKASQTYICRQTCLASDTLPSPFLVLSCPHILPCPLFYTCPVLLSISVLSCPILTSCLVLTTRRFCHVFRYPSCPHSSLLQSCPVLRSPSSCLS